MPPPRAGAEHPSQVTHALTLRGAQLSWAVLKGVKTIENRHFRIAPGWCAAACVRPHAAAPRDDSSRPLTLPSPHRAHHTSHLRHPLLHTVCVCTRRPAHRGVCAQVRATHGRAHGLGGVAAQPARQPARLPQRGGAAPPRHRRCGQGARRTHAPHARAARTRSTHATPIATRPPPAVAPFITALAVPSMPTRPPPPLLLQVSHALAYEECAHDQWAFGPLCNVITHVIELAAPVPHKGALSVWTVQPDALAAVRAQIAVAKVRRAGARCPLPLLLQPPPPRTATPPIHRASRY
jgi:hypothetical protein